MILPLRVLGSESVKRMIVGTRERADLLDHVLRAVRRAIVASPWRAPSSVTNATTAWPFISSGLPTTAASATVGCDTSALSTSIVPSRWPETLITSSTRPMIQK